MAAASFASTAAARDASSSSSSAVTAASPGSSSPRSRRPPAPAPDPYDAHAPRRTSPLPPPNPLSYASGGGSEPGFQDEGDLGARAISRADKGKGRAQRPGDGYGRVAGRDARDGQGPEALEREGAGAGSGAGDGEADEVDEAAEERKVQENLARWSRAEQKRRASIRRSSQFVTPSLPPIPSAPPVPSAATIMRRTSTLVRKASRGRRRRKGANSVVGLGLSEGEELELSGEMQGDGVAARRGRRKLSVKIAEGRDGSRSSVVALSEVGEAPPNELEVDDGDEDALPTPTASTMTTPNLFSSVASSTTTAPAPSNASFVSLSCTTSRFVEDLPPPLSATSSRVSLQLQSGASLSPTSPTAASRANPFSDAVITSPPPPPPAHPAPHSPSPPPPRPSSASEIEIDLTPRSVARPPGPRSRPSQQSVQTFASSTVAPSYYEWNDEPAARPLASAAAAAAGAGAGEGAGAYDSRTSSPMSPAFRPGGRHEMRWRAGDDGYEEEEEEEEPPTVGLLDWLLCGCFRPQGWDRPRGEGGAERYEQQEGRTNPME
ncbi:hypothetical protein JCM1840_004677 [Sporobolomyces johnsonii]